MLSTKQFNQFQSTYNSAYEYTHSFKLFMRFIRSITVNLISFCEMCFTCIKFYFFLKRGKVMDAYGIHSIFFTHKCFIFPHYFLFIPYGFRFRLNILKSIVKS